MSKKTLKSEMPGGDPVSRRSSATPPGDGKRSPFGNHDGATTSGPNSGQHNFSKDPTSQHDGFRPRDFTAESRAQQPMPKPQNTSPYLEGRPQTPGSAAARTNSTDAGKGGVGQMPPGTGAATAFDRQQASAPGGGGKMPFKNMKG